VTVNLYLRARIGIPCLPEVAVLRGASQGAGRRTPRVERRAQPCAYLLRLKR
jgi:hypothetical protein